MAPKALVPADFGVENLYDEFHGNVVLKLKDRPEMKANSMILKMNSPVFGEMFLNLQIRTLEMEDFSGAAVKVFLEALYSGEVQPDKELFRDLNKMANVFRVTWIISKCENYFVDLIKNTSEDSDYNSLLFVFEEARYMKNSVKKPGFLEIIVEKICNMLNKETIFIGNYMCNYFDLSTKQLDLMIKMGGENVSIFIKIIKSNMVKHGLTFDENTNYLLQNINLVKCMEQDRQLYDHLFDLLLEDLGDISSKDLKMLTKLNRVTMKEYIDAKEQITHETRAARPSTSGTEIASLQNIPNLFHNGEQFGELNQDQIYDALFTSTDIKSLYMLIEALDYTIGIYNQVTKELLQAIVQRKRDRGWCAVVPEFIDTLAYVRYDVHHGSQPLKECTELVSDAESKIIVCNEITTLSNLTTKEMTYMFYYKHPQTNKCAQPKQCGFLIKVTPYTRENPEQFNMQLVTDPAMYPAGIHLHSDVISADNIHLAVENDMFGIWENVKISWRDKPQYQEQDEYWCGRRRDTDPARLVAYYNVVTGHRDADQGWQAKRVIYKSKCGRGGRGRRGRRGGAA